MSFLAAVQATTAAQAIALPSTSAASADTGLTFTSFLGKSTGSNTSGLNARFTTDRVTASYDALQLKMETGAPEHAKTLAANREAYLTIFQNAKEAGGLTNPLGFVKSLSAKELEVLQKTHSLAHPIQTSAPTEEGALNLLLPASESQDINSDGITMTGIAQGIVFPPRNAPQALKGAFEKATAGVDAGMALHMQLSMWLQAGGARYADTEGTGTQAPAPFTQPDYNWHAFAERLIAGAEFKKIYETTDVQREFGTKLRAAYQVFHDALKG